MVLVIPRRKLAPMLLALWLTLVGCSAPTATTTGNGKPSAKGPIATATATTNPHATPTVGPVCQGSIWYGVASTAGSLIPLPPQTAIGEREHFPADPNGWSGSYLKLCTSGYPDQVENFIDQHMTTEGWSYGSPTGGCECNAGPVWTRPHDGRQVQFDEHIAVVQGTLRWGVTIFTQG